MASGGRKVTIEFLGKDHSAGKTASDLERKFGKLGARMDSVGRVSGRILAGGLLLVAGAAVKAGQAAADDEMAQAKLAQTLQKATGATARQVEETEAWIAAQGEALGVTDDELRPAIAKLAVATGDLGEAQRLAALAMDVSAGSGKSLDAVVTALQKAQNGSVGGLSRLGVATKNAAGETKSFNEIQKDLAKTYTGAAATAADTTAGKQKILQVRFQELQEEVGLRLQPALLKLTDAGMKVLGWIEQNQTTTAVLVGTLGGLLAITWATTKAIAAWGVITGVASVAVGIHAALTGADTAALAGNKVALAAHAATSKVAAAAQWILNAAMAANPITLVVLALVALGAALVIAYKKSDTFRAIVDKAWQVVGAGAKWMWENAVKPAFAGFKAGIDALGRAGVWLWNNALQPAFKFIIGGVGKILEMWASMLKTLSNVPGFGWAKGAAESMQRAAEKANALANALKPIKDKDVTIRIRYAVMGGPGRNDPDMQGHGTQRFAFGDEAEKGSKKAQKALERLRASLSATKDLFKSLKESVAGAFTTGMFDATNSADFISGLKSTSGKLAGLKAAFKTLLGWGLKPSFLAALFQSGNVDLILDLAKNKASAVEAGGMYGDVMGASSELGGMVAQAEHGDEIKALQDKIKELQDGKNRAGNTYNFYVSGALDEAGVARQIERLIRKYERNMGRAILMPV